MPREAAYAYWSGGEVPSWFGGWDKKVDAEGFQAWGITRGQAEQMIAAGNKDRALAPPDEHTIY